MTGSIILATDQGLGYLAKAFFDNNVIDVVSIHKHTTRRNHYEWYPNSVSEEELLRICDTLIFFETPFNWSIIPKARELGIKTILVPMYECTRYPFPYQPDEIWCPSELDYQFYQEKGEECQRIKIPVDVPWRWRLKARKFVHNAGNGGLGGRNGTKELVEAFKYVKSDARLVLRSQIPITCNNSRIQVKVGTFDDIWKEGDVFIFPEKFNGLSLPIQEAFASGMLVMAGDRFPINEFLPKEPLIPVSGYHKETISVDFQCAEYDPKIIAQKIDEWYDKDISQFSLLGRKYGEKNSWKKLKEILKDQMSA